MEVVGRAMPSSESAVARGLSADEARRRLAESGPNLVETSKLIRRSWRWT